MAITGLLIILFLPNAYSDFASNTKYLIQASGYVASTQSILDSTFVLQITSGAQSGTSMLANLDNGLVTIAGTNYLSSGGWQTTILRNGNFLLLQGDAQDQNGNAIHLNFFGRIVTSNQNGLVYSITGKITGAETFKVIYSAKVTTAGATTIPQAGQTPSGSTITTSQNQTQPNAIRISIVLGASNINTQQYFSPSVVNVLPGTTIIWTNNDSVPHRIMSGTASARIGNASAPTFIPDGIIDSGVIAPGQSFQYTITSFNNKGFLSDAAAKYLNLSIQQTAGDISFFDPNYPFMLGAIGPLSVSTTTTQTAQINILQGASTATNYQFLSPSSVQVTPGSTVVWVNNDSVPHRILSGASRSTTTGGKGAGTELLVPPRFIPDGRIDSGTILPTQSYQFTIKGSGAIAFFDASNTWLNGIIISTPQISGMPPVEVSILPGSYLSQGSASQSNQYYYNQYYSQTNIQISPGTAIIWKNNDNVAHTIWSGTATNTPSNPFVPDGKIKSSPIPPGASFEAIINDTGITRFYDPSYTWMNGVIVSITPVGSSHNIGTICKNCNPFLH